MEIRLTPREFDAIKIRIEARLKKVGLHIHELYPQEFPETFLPVPPPDIILAENRRQKEMDEVERKLGTVRGNPETTPWFGLNQLFYEEAARVLTNKFTRRGLNWLKKTLGEKGIKIAVRTNH